MAKTGAQYGNKNSAKGKIWSDVIRRVALRDKKRLERIANALLSKAEDGDVPALKELGDRMEGKIPQAIEGSGADGSIPVSVTVKFV